ncbi:hypothetical protein DASC09_037330 [Saccharomycopsis crataegensis]|uniref:MICOS complex subunit MIC12 n=1 Tax=Saccharomycopsis crataegensis TaxID=43959 RepID=A0AAV5QNF3_9ASCO|nr:hypothetical protein DASC09_037330 [Saccharomycopsis crataegensis]
MSGRIHGFLGGVLLTSSLTYLTALEFRKNRDIVSQSLITSKDIIENRHNRDTTYVPGTNSINYNDRSNIRESFADIWNSEIIKGVNWVYSINWLAAGEKVERGLRKLVESK